MVKSEHNLALHTKFKKKVLNCLWGLHIGDSLGASIEFEGPRKQAQFHTEIIGQGPFNWRPGEPTDDTQLMILLLKSIQEEPYFSQENYARKLINWMDSNPVDIGTTTKASIKRLKEGFSFSEAGVRNEENQTNGSLMRCAPLAAFFQSKRLMEVARLQTELTHAHPNCIIADQFYLALLHEVLHEAKQSRKELVDRHLEVLRKNYPLFFQSLNFNSNELWENLVSTGSVFDTLRIVLWAFIKLEKFEDALIWAINRGGDSDTVGAILGSLVGAYSEELPDRWLQKIEKRSEIDKLVNQILSTGPS